MQLVHDVRNWTKWWSIRFLAMSAFAQAVIVAYATLPSDWLPAIPTQVKLGFAMFALVTAGFSGVARLVHQPKLECRDDGAPLDARGGEEDQDDSQ